MEDGLRPAGQGTLPCMAPPDTDLRRLSALELLQKCVRDADTCEEPVWPEFLVRIRPFVETIIGNTIRHWKAPNLALIDDLVQNTYLKLCSNDFKALREFDCPQESALFGFLKVVASNVVQDHFRSLCCQKRGSGKGEDDLERARPLPDQLDSFSRVLEQRILIGQIERCLRSHAAEARFARDYRIFWLYYSQGLTAKEIALQPNIDLGTKGVESTLLRLTRTIKVKLNRQPGRASVGRG